MGSTHKVPVQRTWWSVIQNNLIRIQFESHYLTSICHCVISSWDLVKPKNCSPSSCTFWSPQTSYINEFILRNSDSTGQQSLFPRFMLIGGNFLHSVLEDYSQKNSLVTSLGIFSNEDGYAKDNGSEKSRFRLTFYFFVWFIRVLFSPP